MRSAVPVSAVVERSEPGKAQRIPKSLERDDEDGDALRVSSPRPDDWLLEDWPFDCVCARALRPRAPPPSRPIAAMCARSRLTASPPLRPATRASSGVHSCAVPFACAALPPLLAISRWREASIDAKPRLLR